MVIQKNSPPPNNHEKRGTPSSGNELKRLILSNRLQMNELELDIFLENLSKNAATTLNISPDQLAIDIELLGKNLDFIFTFKNPLKP
ncbi:MAG: hypothetical protein HQM08_14920 [Candidatus Riflebacteria bacterium]|nr:hypothetical protein [Candidatus Riflebacteria bacterium]